ncbi:MAG: methylglutamate dehydrogenase [Pseudomonadota bacterium]
MSVPLPHSPAPAATLSLTDLTVVRQLVGVKGPKAAQWLANLGLPLPETANHWLALDDDRLIARLGLSEFLLDGPPGSLDTLAATPRTHGVYPVLRQDAAFLLCGAGAPELLAQVCSLDFATLEVTPGALALTSMAGVGVTLLPQPGDGGSRYRLWCDGSYGLYLWETLREIAEALGGDAVDAQTCTESLP